MMILLAVIGVAAFLLFSNKASAPINSQVKTDDAKLVVTPVEHASFVLKWGDVTIFNDPVGKAEKYQSFGKPDIVLLSDIHEDHFNVAVLENLVSTGTLLIVPNEVYKKLPKSLAERTTVMSNGDIHTIGDITVTAMPMYNLPASSEAYHVKGRGNGYILESGETKIYIAGDTADIPEMLALTDVDMAFIPMNLPYTMDVPTAVKAVLAFAPKVVYPYHYRGTDGLSDVSEFARQVTNSNPAISVKLLDWYPEGAEIVE